MDKKDAGGQQSAKPSDPASEFEGIGITRIIAEGITEPRNDGTRGSALYAIPFALSAEPPMIWARMFVSIWDQPPSFTTMHRPGIARVAGATVTLDGTTIEEVEQVHRETLKLVLAETNRQYREWLRDSTRARERELTQREDHRRHVEDAAKRIKFD